MDFDRYQKTLRRTAEECRINFDRLCAHYSDDWQVRKRELDRANAQEAALKQQPNPREGMDATTAEALMHRFAFEAALDKDHGFYDNATLELQQKLGLKRGLGSPDDPTVKKFQGTAQAFLDELGASRVVAIALNADKSLSGARLDVDKDLAPADQLRRGLGRARLAELDLGGTHLGKQIALEYKVDAGRSKERTPFGQNGFKAELNTRTQKLFAHHGFYRAETPLNTLADLWNEGDAAFKKQMAPLAAGIFGAARDITQALSSSRVAGRLLEDAVPNLFGVSHDYQALAADAEARRAPRRLCDGVSQQTETPGI